MLNGADDVSYVMADGLTSFSGDNVGVSNMNSEVFVALSNASAPDFIYVTFIGTGIAVRGTNWSANAFADYTAAQNLPYGTHVLRIDRNTSSVMSVNVDGVEVYTATSGHWHMQMDYSIYQPKRPPIPDDAVVLADYMLMAEFKPVAGAREADNSLVGKGTRRLNASREYFYRDTDAAFTFQHFNGTLRHTQVEHTSATSTNNTYAEIPGFFTNFVEYGYDVNARHVVLVNGSIATTTNTDGTSNWGTGKYLSTSYTEPEVRSLRIANGTSTNWNLAEVDFASPIHTSSHYQSFETPFTYDLVGGDRNMEQTNLVVTADGKTWDQVVRDTSYIGNIKIHMRHDTQNHTWLGTPIIFDEQRGTQYLQGMVQKDFAWAYREFYCLVDGQYEIQMSTYQSQNQVSFAPLYLNGTQVGYMHIEGSNTGSRMQMTQRLQLKRGDRLQSQGRWSENLRDNFIQIVRLN